MLSLIIGGVVIIGCAITINQQKKAEACKREKLLDFILSKYNEIVCAVEERRLFYVAMTRAKDRLYLIANKNIKSKFILELEGKIINQQNLKCPNCKTADLIKRTGITNNKEWAFMGCSNYVYGCDYQRWL